MSAHAILYLGGSLRIIAQVVMSLIVEEVTAVLSMFFNSSQELYATTFHGMYVIYMLSLLFD